MSDNETYKNRDIILGKILENSEHTKLALKDFKESLEKHKDNDKKRFNFTWIALLAVALFAGVIPQMAAWALERFK